MLQYNIPVVWMHIRQQVLFLWLSITFSCIHSPQKLSWQLKSSFPKPDKSILDENWVFNIIVQNYIRALVTELNLDSDNSRKHFFFF